MYAKITAASVASASTTAPRLTRRFCFMPRLEWDTPSRADTRCKSETNREPTAAPSINPFISVVSDSKKWKHGRIRYSGEQIWLSKA